jgi:iron complex outermembrane receptor protein
MRSLNTTVLSSISLAALITSPAFAQATPAAPVDTTPQKTQQSQDARKTAARTNAEGQPASGAQTIVVTGSRIRRDNFSTPQNVDIVTRQDQVLAGTTSTAEALQQATITSGTSQINGAFLGFVSQGGSAASTIGLRGLGATRTLVLLNGRRLAPAGVGNQLVAADLNVLPTSIVQRIEVLREGASSIYGSDAIAGVINVITDTSINGVTIDGFANHPSANHGDTVRGSVTAGKTFDRGHITGSFEYKKFTGLRVGDRSIFSCPRDLFSVNGHEVGQLDPGTGQLRCFPFEYDSLGIASGYGIGVNLFTGTLGRYTYPGYLTGNPVIGPPVRVDIPLTGPLPGYDFRPSPGPEQLLSHLISPTKTYTAYLNGSYELGTLGDAELYGEGLFTRRESHQDNAYQLTFDPNLLGPTVQNVGSFTGGQCDFGESSPGVSYCSPFWPKAWSAAGVNYFNPFIEPDKTSRDTQKVNFFRGNAGLRGNVGLGDWRYDANFQVSRTSASEDVVNPNTSHLINALVAVPAPSGTPGSLIVTGLPGQQEAGVGLTCASNLTNGAYNGGSCVPLNYFDPQILLHGHIPNNVYNYIWTDNFDETKFHQDTAQLVFDGTLFPLPGGNVKAAVGIEHRHDYLKDVPSEAALTGNLYRRAVAGVTEGSDIVNEAFGELNMPFFKDRPGLNLLELDASGRYTHYRSYGSGWTYHLSAQWAPIAAIRFRGNYGTNFRAPNLYEQFVADQTGFQAPQVDPCNTFASTAAPGSNRYNNCLAALTPILGQTGALNYVSTSGPEVTTRGGHGLLKAEKAKTWGFGAIFTMPRRIADFTFAVDYWNINVKGEVNTLGTTILSLCYDSSDFPNNPYCALIAPRAPSGSAHPGALTAFDDPYLNVAKQQASGIDFDVRYAVPLLGGHFQTQLQATRNLHQNLEIFAGAGAFDYNGTPGFPGFGAGPKVVGSLDTRFTTSGNVTFRWGVKYVGKQDNARIIAGDLVNGKVPLPQPDGTVLLADYDQVAEAYWEHGVSVQWLWPKVGQVTIGMNNVFNRAPPSFGGWPTVNGQLFRIGNSLGGGSYDYLGRSVFVNVTRSF